MARITNAETLKREREISYEYDVLINRRRNASYPGQVDSIQKEIDKNSDKRHQLKEQEDWDNYVYDLVETMLCGTGVTCYGCEQGLVEIARNVVNELRYGHE